MEISADYLHKVRTAVRRSENIETDEELTDLVKECRADLISLGVLEERAVDENDPLILGAVRCFVRWKFGLSGDDRDGSRRDYMQLRDELRKRVAYCTIQSG